MLGRNKQPTPEELAEIDRKNQIVVGELGDPNWQSAFGQRLPFDNTTLVDPQVLKRFDPEEKEFYHPCYQPLQPFVSPTIATGQLTEKELRQLKRKVNRAKAEAYCLATERIHYFIINSLVAYIWAYQLGSARHGFKLRQLTENRKTLRLLEPEKKRKWLPF